MKLYLISQDKNSGYDAYDSAVVAAVSSNRAKQIHPKSGPNGEWNSDTWCSSPDEVMATFIGEAKSGTKEGVIVASFYAG